MHPLLEANRDAIAALCRRYGVMRLDVFGSILREDFDAGPSPSDVDVVAEFKRSDEINAFDQYFGLKEALEALLSRPIDLVSAKGVKNPYVKRFVEATKKPLYAA